MSTSGPFREFFDEVAPIRIREPLAETLGAFTTDGAVLEYTFSETVKAAGHACPTVTGAFLGCQAALAALYLDEIPVRGDIAVTVYGDPGEGALGVMAQVFTFITGAAPETGFKGLGPRFRRRNLLTYSSDRPEGEASTFRFERLDTGTAVILRFYPWLIPFPTEKAQRLAAVMQLVVGGGADDAERREFQDLWSEKIRAMAVKRREIDSWLTLEAV